MKRISLLLVFAALFLQSCGKNRTEKVLGPAETVTHLADSVAKGDGFQVWAALPKTWRNDINGIAHKIGNQMPAELWDKSFKLIGRVGKILSDKSELFAATAEKQGQNKDDAKAVLVETGKFLTKLSKSEIATVASLKSVDLADFSEDSLSSILKIFQNKAMENIMKQTSKGKISSITDAMAKVKAELISEEGDTAKVKITDPDGEVDEVTMKKVEGKWLPEEMVKDFKTGIKEFEKELDGMLAKAKELAPKAPMVIGMVEGILGSIEAANSEEDLQKAFSGSPVNPLAMFGALGKASEKAKMAQSKSHLKQMGTAVAYFFADGTSAAFPEDPSKYDFPSEVLVHPSTQKVFTVKDIFAGKGDYIPVFKAGDTYSGSSEKALFVEKPGLWEDDTVIVVYEDGHVDQIKASTMDQVKTILKIK